MAQPAEKLVIQPSELADARVDEALARQLSFGMAPPAERVQDARTGLLQRGYVALALAGALGALAGWALLEPLFDDGLRFQARVDAVQAPLTMEDGTRFAWVDAGGVRVFVPERDARLERDGAPLSLEALAVGQVVDVTGEPFGSGAPQVAARRLEVLVGVDAAQLAPVSLEAASRRQHLVGLLAFVVVAGFVGLFIGAVDGLLSRAFQRAAVCGAVGLGMGLAVGLVATVVAGLVYGMGTGLVARLGEPGATRWSAAQLIVQMAVRGVAWSLAGAAMGLGQGVALRSSKLLGNGLVGGMVGALVGGLLFDPIDLLVGGTASGSAALSRGVGFGVIGLVTGFMIGVVELVAREAWIKMLTGPLAGKEFVLFKSPTTVGSSPKSDVYLFKDPEVEPSHALLHAQGEGYELEDRKSRAGTFVNGRRVSRVRLQSGDQVRVGKTVFALTVKEG